MSAPVALPGAPVRKAKRAYTTKRMRAEADADDLDWILGGGPAPRDGGVCKLTCTPPSSDNEVARIVEATPVRIEKPIATPAKAFADLLSKYKPIAVRRCQSDDFLMEKSHARTEPIGKPCA